ncbi:hypothetical protein B0H14DRAFT_3433313 [Mycena olivaceomarginata]|nr:hypothetical protein B0H14DRAFT_3433313 [Mycena olivaceomarginata]
MAVRWVTGDCSSSPSSYHTLANPTTPICFPFFPSLSPPGTPRSLPRPNHSSPAGTHGKPFLAGSFACLSAVLTARLILNMRKVADTVE